MTKILFLLSSLLLFSCNLPTLKSKGGTRITLSSTEDFTEETADNLLNRLRIFSRDPDFLSYKIKGQKLTIDAVSVQDTQVIRDVFTRDRMMKVTYAIPPSTYSPIRKYLADFIDTPTTKLPYKPSSFIGLVSRENKEKVITTIKSPAFTSTFPSAGVPYYGIKKMEGKYALFIDDKNAPAMTQEMFDEIGAHRGKDPGEGQLSLTLNDKYADRIGKLTGNDSTYLLHIFHNEVYISKIIKPHITEPSFGMAGAFSEKDVMILSALWNSDELTQDLTITSIEIVK